MSQALPPQHLGPIVPDGLMQQQQFLQQQQQQQQLLQQQQQQLLEQQRHEQQQLLQQQAMQQQALVAGVLGSTGLMMGAPPLLALPTTNPAALARPPHHLPGMAPLGMAPMGMPGAGVMPPSALLPQQAQSRAAGIALGLAAGAPAGVPRDGGGAQHVDAVAAQLGIPLKRAREEPGAGGTLLATTTQVTVAQMLVPCLVGRGGCNVKRVKQLSGAQITLREAEGNAPTKRVFDVSGPLEATSTALHMLQALIARFSPPPGATLCLCGASHALSSVATSNLGSAHPAFKTKMCPRLDKSGGCQYGARCHFAHSAAELKPASGGGSDGAAAGKANEEV